MNSKKLGAVFALAAVFILVLGGCATTIKTQVLMPAKAHKAAQLRRIAVLPFSGSQGDRVCADIEALLVKIRVNGEPFFTVMERKAINKIVDEQAFQLSGAVDEKTALQVGKLAGAEGIVFGTVTQCTTEDKSYSEERSKCVAKNKKGDCIEWSKYTVHCTERNAYFSFTPKVVDIATGEIVASESLCGHSGHRTCRDSNTPLAGKREILGQAKTEAVAKFRELVAPYYVTVEIKLLKKDDTKMSAEVKEKIAAGIKWAKEGRLDRACELWHEADRLHPAGYAIPYLLGVCAEVSGALDKALSYYEQADRKTGSPVKEISEALGRVRLSIDKRKKLEEQIRN